MEGVYEQKIYDQIQPNRLRIQPLDGAITTAVECAVRVHQASFGHAAAEFSNDGTHECYAIYEASGVVYDPKWQTCLFDDAR